MQSTSEGVEQSVQRRAEFTAAVFVVCAGFWREPQIHRTEVIGRVISVSETWSAVKLAERRAERGVMLRLWRDLRGGVLKPSKWLYMEFERYAYFLCFLDRAEHGLK